MRIRSELVEGMRAELHRRVAALFNEALGELHRKIEDNCDEIQMELEKIILESKDKED